MQPELISMIERRENELCSEIGRLRAALIRSGRAVGAILTDDVSTDFLMLVPQEIELVMAKLKLNIVQD